MVNGMFEPCPIINYKMCGFCTHNKGHIFCGASSAKGNNKIEENLFICPIPKKRKQGAIKRQMII